jgi:transcription antitermination factor NusG
MYLNKQNYAWYAIYSKPNREKKVLANLQEEGIECYLPLLKTLKQWSDRKKWIEEPLFRSYVFVRVSNIEFFNVLHLLGVVCYVRFGGKPQTIPDNQIENIKTFIKQEEKEVIVIREKIAKGVKAEVLYGPFKGVQGEVIQICGQSRILIRVESMGCCLSANISMDEIKILKTESQKGQKTKRKLVPNFV